MPHATLKLQPGVDQNRTIALNEAAISYSTLIRFVPDKQGIGLVQKLGGWTRFFPSSVGSIVRALWAWKDTNAITYLGLGAENRTVVITALANNIVSGTNFITITYAASYAFTVGQTIVVSGVTPTAYNGTYSVTSSTTTTVTFAGTNSGAMTVAGIVYAGDALSVISDNVRTIITPRTLLQDVAVSAATSAGSSTVIITAAGSNIYSSDSVDIQTQISIGGLILFGLYTCTFLDGSNQFYITALDSLGEPILATSTATGGTIPSFSFTNNLSDVDVTLANHGLVAGDTFTVIVPLTAAGITLSGNYIVQSVASTSIFRIFAKNTASSTTTASLNGGLAQYLYYKTPGALPASTGYGVGGYGAGGYGTGVAPSITVSGNPITATDWSLDNWGEIFVACPVNQPIFIWSPNSGIKQSGIVPNCPTVNDGVFVAMPQRQMIAWGSTFTGIQDPLLIRWCDVNDYSVWSATLTNQAGSYRVPRGSRIVGCIQGPQQGLVWTDLAVWAMQYVGPPYVYQFNELGTGCGLISRKAAGSMNGTVYWMGQSQFFKLGGSGVELITCPIWDVIFQDLDRDNLDKIRIAPNSRFGEISWYYPTQSNGGEVNAYVKYNVSLNTWDFGTLSRTAWINESVLGAPIGSAPVSTQNLIYQHETSPDADGQPMTSSFQTGYFAISDGEYKVFVDQVWPDMKWGYYGGLQDADLTLTFYVSDYPHQTARTYGPYPFNNQTDFITPRFRGRLMSIKMESSDIGSFWRIGATRYRFEQDGKF
jgi:hypothetical protein